MRRRLFESLPGADSASQKVESEIPAPTLQVIPIAIFALVAQIGRAPPSTISCLSLYLLAAKCLHLTGRPVHPERQLQQKGL